MAKADSNWIVKHKVLSIIIGFVLLIIIISAAGNNRTNISNTPASTNSATTKKASTQQPIAHVGSTVDIGGSKGLAVQIQQIIDPASGVDQYTTPNAGKRFVAVKLQITNNGSASYNDDANSNVTLIGSDNQSYTADYNSVSECTNFSSGEYTLASGESATGCVVYQVPDAVTAAKVQFQTEEGLSTSTGEWLVP